MITLFKRLNLKNGNGVPITKGQVIEEPCDGKLSRTVLKGRWDAVMLPSTQPSSSHTPRIPVTLSSIWTLHLDVSRGDTPPTALA